MLAAAWLHDVLEDTVATTVEVEDVVGPEVLQYVLALTDCNTTIGNRAFRKSHDRARLSAAPEPAKTIKLADLIDNTSSIVDHDKNFARVYLKEKELLLPCLKGGDASLWNRAFETLQKAQEAMLQAKLGEGRV